MQPTDAEAIQRDGALQAERVKEYFDESQLRGTNPGTTQPSAEGLNNASRPATRPADILPFPQYKGTQYSPAKCVWALKEWDGRVTSINHETFVGILSPVGASAGVETEDLECPLDMLGWRDRENLAPGSIFRLVVGYSKSRTGQVKQETSIYFRKRSSDSPRGAAGAAKLIEDFFADAKRGPTAAAD